MISNLRDLGGMRTADNRTIRRGMLIRSADLTNAEKEDLEGISAVIDLRTTRETVERPDKVYGAELLHIPIFDQITAGISHEEEAEDVQEDGERVHGFLHISVYGVLDRDRRQFDPVLTDS